MKQINVKRKNIWKVLRSLLQAALVLGIAYLAVQNWLFPIRYKQVDAKGQSSESQAQDQQAGFIALSYLGVEPLDTRAKVVIPQDKLAKHLAALKASGFVTITQQELLDYYQSGSPLPARAMYLMFEDGNKDTATMVQGLLQKHNYHASIWTYAADLDGPRKSHFTSAELKELNENTFWEAGVSGYRLAYINTFDRYGRYVGQLNRDEYYKAMPFLDRRYNHFLMDFLRDEDEVPLENNLQMAERIQNEYQLMDQVYSTALGSLPKGYTLMHANTGKFGSHELVSAENERHIKEQFQFNFNREGFATNNLNNGVYDLTRMQPYAHWPANHLLLRLQLETGQDMAFVQGNPRQANKFTLLEGKAEFDGNTLNLTSAPEGHGRLHLKEQLSDAVSIEAQLLGNVYGSQLVYFGTGPALLDALGVGLVDNHLVVRQLRQGEETELFRKNLAELNEGRLLSKAEDQQQVMVGVMDAIIHYDDNPVRIQEAEQMRAEALIQQPQSLAQGGEPHVPPVDQLQRGNRHLRIQLKANQLNVWVDSHALVTDLSVAGPMGRHLVLESRPIPPEYNQRNIYDPIYDAVFRDLSIRGGEAGQSLYFTNGYHIVDKGRNLIVDVWREVTTWFANNM